MFQVLYRFTGNGLWSPWFLPSSVQAAVGQVRTLRKDEAVEVRVALSGAQHNQAVDIRI